MSLVIPENSSSSLSQRTIVIVIGTIVGMGKRYICVVSRKGNIDLTKRAGKLIEDKVEHVIAIMLVQDLTSFPEKKNRRLKKMVNRIKFWKNYLNNKLHEDLE
ncbi:40S ribosomal protein S18-like [Onychomys torridus]|uniref:40S ribosomal protein S18-like n=1 Tax=Onychomys torridus TaxID=38674 RepID=UPI00167F7B20|nr:40S ribosomal protein S18-like [Onychomys torridus]